MSFQLAPAAMSILLTLLLAQQTNRGCAAKNRIVEQNDVMPKLYRVQMSQCIARQQWAVPELDILRCRMGMSG